LRHYLPHVFSIKDSNTVLQTRSILYTSMRVTGALFPFNLYSANTTSLIIACVYSVIQLTSLLIRATERTDA